MPHIPPPLESTRRARASQPVPHDRGADSRRRSAPVADGDTVTCTLPESVTVLGTTVAVKTWREVLSATLETLAGAEPAKFARLPDRFPSYLATSPQGFRAPKPLASGYFIETNLGAASIHRFCQRAVAALELPPEAWAVQVKPPAAVTP